MRIQLEKICLEKNMVALVKDKRQKAEKYKSGLLVGLLLFAVSQIEHQIYQSFLLINCNALSSTKSFLCNTS